MHASTQEDTRPFAWYRTLGPRGRRAFGGAFGGYGLDSYDYWVLPFGLGAIIAYFGLTPAQGGLLGTTTLVVSAIGGAVAVLLWAWRRNFLTLQMFDVAAVPLAIGYAIGRIGCQLAGDGDYGIPWDGPWAMAYPNGTVPTTSRSASGPIARGEPLVVTTTARTAGSRTSSFEYVSTPDCGSDTRPEDDRPKVKPYLPVTLTLAPIAGSGKGTSTAQTSSLKSSFGGSFFPAYFFSAS